MIRFVSILVGFDSLRKHFAEFLPKQRYRMTAKYHSLVQNYISNAESTCLGC